MQVRYCSAGLLDGLRELYVLVQVFCHWIEARVCPGLTRILPEVERKSLESCKISSSSSMVEWITTMALTSLEME